jgi:hypothetical protein
MNDIRTRPATKEYRENFPFPEKKRKSAKWVGQKVGPVIKDKAGRIVAGHQRHAIDGAMEKKGQKL